MNADLFPETLLVYRDGARIYTDSLKVAEYFEKRHTHVLRAIEALRSVQNVGDRLKIEPISSASSNDVSRPNFGPRNPSDTDLIKAFWRLNFEPRTYTDERGKEQPAFDLTHDGFALLAMGFTGKEALVWKIKFLEAFRLQERALAQMTARYAHALDIVRPALRPVVEGTEAGLNRQRIAEPLGKSTGAVTYHRRRARQLGLLL